MTTIMGSDYGPRRTTLPQKTAFIYNDILSRHILRENHVMVPTRLRYTYELLEAYGVFRHPAVQLVEPRKATEEELSTFHSKEYIAAVQSLSAGEATYSKSAFGFSQDGDNPVFPGMYEAYLWSTGASLSGLELLLNHEVDIAFNPAGGLHHAMPNYASGFCVFNDPVIAIKQLLQLGFRAVYVDIDCHHGDGVQHAFYDTDRVLTISLHEAGTYIFPGTGFTNEIGVGDGIGYSVNLPFFPQTDDSLYIWAFDQIVPPLVRQFQPDILVTQLGLDTHFQDPITHMGLTVKGFSEVVQQLANLGYPWLALGGGGYDISAVTRGWSLAFAKMLGITLPNTVPQLYQDTYGITKLLDQEEPQLDSWFREQGTKYAQENVEFLQHTIFPRHGL